MCVTALQVALRERYSYLVPWVDQLDEAFLAVLRSWEAKGKLVAESLKALRFVLEPERRQAVLLHAQGERATLKTTLDRADELSREQYAQWHLRDAPPEHVHGTKRMSLVHPALVPAAVLFHGSCCILGSMGSPVQPDLAGHMSHVHQRLSSHPWSHIRTLAHGT